MFILELENSSTLFSPVSLSEVTIFYKKDISNIRIISEGGESEVYLGFNQLFG